MDWVHTVEFLIDHNLGNFRITINFTHFDIEGNNQDCEYDSLTISSKMGSEEARNHGLFCGNKLPPVSWGSNPTSFNIQTERTNLYFQLTFRMISKIPSITFKISQGHMLQGKNGKYKEDYMFLISFMDNSVLPPWLEPTNIELLTTYFTWI